MSSNIVVYPQEIQDGLSEQIKNNSFAFLTAIAEDIDISSKVKIKPRKLIETQPDLFYMTSLLVSTGWNGNDEVFLKNEIWKARKTVANKKINAEHDEDFIIGHMIGSYVVDDDGNEIEDDRDEADLPDNFHIIDDGVIYSAWQGEEKIDYMTGLLESIKNGEKFVSMECLFSDFDYAFKNDKEEFIVARNASTSFLTAKLRVHKGDGTYKGYKIGRVPKNFIFSGKGIVDAPANPNSYILSAASLQKFSGKNVISDINFEESCVLTKDKEMIMSEEIKAYELAKANLDRVTKENETLKNKLEQAEAKFNETIANDLNGKVTALEAKLAIASTNEETAQTKLDTAEKTIAQLQKQIEEVNAAKEAILAEAAKKEKENKVMACKNTLIQAGVQETDAEASAPKWADAAPELFSEYVASLARKKESQENANASKPSVTEEATKVLETAEASKDIPGSTDSEESNKSTILSLASMFKKDKGTK